MASVGSRSSAVRSDAHQNAGDSAAARQRRQQDWTGFPGCLSWGECPTGCCRCRRAAAPGSVCWRIEGQRGKRRPRGPPQPRKGGQPTGARPRRTAKPGAETSPDLPAAQEQAGDPAAGGESARRNCAAGGTWRTAPAPGPPPQEGCRGRRKAIKERAPASTATGPLAGQISVLSRRSTQVAVCCGAADAATQIRRQ